MRCTAPRNEEKDQAKSKTFEMLPYVFNVKWPARQKDLLSNTMNEGTVADKL